MQPRHGPRRGEIYWVTFTGTGSEQSGRRPALVVQNDRGNQSSPVTVVVPLSTAPLPRTYPFTVLVHAGEANLTRAGYVNCSQPTTVDQSRLEGRVGMLSSTRMLEVDQALRYELDL